jgi:serine/threonine-protein kinase
MSHPDLTGTVLAGKYRIEGLLGRGGMGSVWRALHLGLHAPVAVKLLDLATFLGGAEALNRFHREARAAAAIRSPHVVQILDHGVDEALGAPFIVMELMQGESLAQRLARTVRISPAEVARVFTHVARALSRAHEAGIVHRDLKPDNVFLVSNDDEEVAKVLDFGIAKAQANGMTTDSATRTGAVMGTAYYMSPEQISGSRNVDFRTDIWAYGVMACECVTGRRPFDAETIGGLTLRICVEPLPIPSRLGTVPLGFDAWFARAVNRDPLQRFSSAREAAEALRQVCTGTAQVTSTSGTQQLPPQVGPTHSQTVGGMSGAVPTAGSLSVSTPNLDPRSAKRSSGGLVLALLAVALLAGGGFWWQHRAAASGIAEAAASANASATATTKRSAESEAPLAASTPIPVAESATPEPATAASAPLATSSDRSPDAPRGVATTAQARSPRAPAAATPVTPPRPAPPPLAANAAAAPVEAAKAPAAAPPVKPARDVIEDRH